MGVTAALLAAVMFAATPEVTGVEVRLPQGASSELLEGVTNLVAVRRGQTWSARAVRRSIERLMETGRFAGVRALGIEGPQGLLVVFELEPKSVIAELYSEGLSALKEDEVLKAARLAPGEEIDFERQVDAARSVAAHYQRRGYLDARVEVVTEPAETGVNVVVRVLEGEPTRVRSVVVEGDGGEPLPVLLELVGVERDQVVDLEQLSQGLRRLEERLRAKQHWRVRVGAPSLDRDGRLRLPVQAGPRFELRFEGARVFADSALRSALGPVGEEPLDEAVRERLAERLEALYRFHGFTDARVTPRERESPDGREALLTFAIDEGEQVLVHTLEVRGNQALSASELRSVLSQVVRASTPDFGPGLHPLADPVGLEGRVRSPRWVLPPEPEPEQIFIEAAWRDALKAMAQRYHELGYLSAEVRLVAFERSPEGNRAELRVIEGPRAFLRSIKVLAMPAGADADVVLPSPGTPFSERLVERARSGLRQALVRKGHAFGTVEAEWTVSPDGTGVELAMRAQPGPTVTVGKVLVRGIARTREWVVRDVLTLHEGETLDLEALVESQRALAGLGIFRGVDVRLLSPEVVESVKDVVVELKERPRLSGEFGLGYFIAEGPRFVVDAEVPNVGGLAINVSARARLNFFAASAPALARIIDVSDLQGFELFGGRGNVSFFNRGLLPFGIGARLDLVGERVFRQSYRFARFAAVPGLDWSVSLPWPKLEWTRPKVTLQLQYELEWARVFQVQNASGATYPLTLLDQERLRFLFGTFALHTFRFAPTLDLRDDAVVPRKGLLLQVAAETTLDAYSRADSNSQVGVSGNQYVPVQFVKLAGTLSGYVPLGNRAVLALSLRGGRILPLTQGSVTPPVKRFFLGGASSMRGFREDGLLADDQRNDYAAQVQACRALASNVGCTPAARTLASGRELASQGGELFTLGKAELRFPAFGALDLGVFVEAGNLWLAVPEYGFRLRTVTGAGIRYVTPVGPLALDVGLNPFADALVNEPIYNVHFNIGLF